MTHRKLETLIIPRTDKDKLACHTWLELQIQVAMRNMKTKSKSTMRTIWHSNLIQNSKCTNVLHRSRGNWGSKTYRKRVITTHHKIHLHTHREAVYKSAINQLYLDLKLIRASYNSFCYILVHFIPKPNNLSFKINEGFSTTRNLLISHLSLHWHYKSLIHQIHRPITKQFRSWPKQPNNQLLAKLPSM